MENTLIRPIRAAAAVLAAAALTGCGSWFDPAKDVVIDPNTLSGPAAITTLRDGARGDFAAGFLGDYLNGNEGIALVSGLVSDEYDNGDTFPTRTEFDQRDVNVLGQNVDLLNMYLNMHRARTAADNAAARARTIAPDSVDAIGESQSLAALVVLQFAENFCSGVPLSSVDSAGKLVYGAQSTTAQLQDLAAAKFDSVVALNGVDPTYLALAHLGKARVLLDKGQYDAAAAEATLVPTEFRYATVHSGTNDRTTNAAHGFFYLGFRWTVGVGLGAATPFSFVTNFGTANDPRLPIDASLSRFDGEGTEYAPVAFNSRSSPGPVATGIEARLIEAEAQLKAGNGAWLTTLNNLRATVPGLAPLADPGTAQERLKLLFTERGFWLFGQNLRLSDERRLIRQYNFPQDQVLTVGEYLKGGTYGTDVNLPIPFEERNNPSVTVGSDGVCLDRNP
jgi:hypothetical protein